MKNEIIHEKVEFESFRSLLNFAAEKYGTKTAFSYKSFPHDKERIKKSYLDLQADARALGSFLISQGMKGKHVAIVAKLSYSWVVTYFAALSSGAVLVPLDRDWKADDLADTAKNADVDMIFYDSDVLDKAQAMSDAIGNCPMYSTDLADILAEGEKIYGENPALYDENELEPKKLSLLVFTSGTTGKGKGVMLTQHSLLSDMSAAYPYIDFGARTVGILPPHHTYGSNIMFTGHVMIGSEVYISSGLKYITKEFSEIKPTHLILVPLYLETIYRKIRATLNDRGIYKKVMRFIKISNCLRKIGIDIRKKAFAKIREIFGGSCKMVVSGGAPLSTDIFDFYEGIGISILNGYGITECSPIIAVNHSRSNVRGSVGPALEVNEVKIMDPNENGEGEICVRGDNVMLGYYKNKEATEDAIMSDGFFKTGDYGKISSDGKIFITGRSKNLIILSNGKNVYPEEIESVLASAQGLLDVIVYEGQSKRGISENKIVAEIYPDYELLKKRGIEDAYAHFKKFVDDYNRDAVPYKKIGLIKIRETDFPKNTLRKIKRFELDMTID